MPPIGGTPHPASPLRGQGIVRKSDRTTTYPA